jgi:hypothetical protein
MSAFELLIGGRLVEGDLTRDVDPAKVAPPIFNAAFFSAVQVCPAIKRPSIAFGGPEQSGVGVEFAQEGFHEFTRIHLLNLLSSRLRCGGWGLRNE